MVLTDHKDSKILRQAKGMNGSIRVTDDFSGMNALPNSVTFVGASTLHKRGLRLAGEPSDYSMKLNSNFGISEPSD